MLDVISDYSVQSGYKIDFTNIDNAICMVLPCGLRSSPLKKEHLEETLSRALRFGNDLALKELFPTEFKFDFFLTIEAWKDLIICERRSPFETDGLSKKEAEWAWILVSQWETTPVDSKDQFIDLYSQSQMIFEALGWDAYLNEDSKEKLLDLFSIKTPLLVNYKPSKKIMEFYKNIWNPIKNCLKKT